MSAAAVAWAEPLTLSLSTAHALSARAAGVLAIPPDLFKFVAVLFTAVLVAPVYRILRTPTQRHAFALVGGVVGLQFVAGSGWIHAAVIASIAYLLMALPLPVRALGHWQHVVAAAGSFAYLTWRHTYRVDVSADSLDVVAPLMVMTVRMFTFVYALYDGTHGAAALHAGIARAEEQAATAGTEEEARHARRRLAILRRRAAYALPRLPTPLEYYAYIFNLVTLLAGPALEFSDYLRAQQEVRVPGTRSRIPTACLRLLEGIACMGVQVVGQRVLPLSAIVSNATAADALPFWRELLYAHASLSMLRFGYYGVWKVAEAACILAGFGWREADDSWTAAANAHVWKLETGTSFKAVLHHWNIFTQSWLENYIFLRAPRTLQLNLWLTFFASAFWHGLYPGYYLAFLTLPFLQAAAALLHSFTHRVLSPATLAYKGVTGVAYRLCCLVCTQLGLDYALVAFNLYTWDATIATWASWHWYGHIAAACVIVGSLLARRVFQFPKPKSLPVGAVSAVDASPAHAHRFKKDT